MSQMLLRIAVILHRAQRYCDRPDRVETCPECLNAARLVLEGMKESTVEMDVAASKLAVQVDGVSTYPPPEVIWEKMITTALED